MTFRPASLRLPPMYNCPHCNNEMSETGQGMISIHFADKKCPHCSNDVDVWAIATSILDQNPMKNLMNTILDFAGFIGMYGSIFIRPFSTTEINLHDEGLPKNTVIKSINYAPEGGNSFPLETHGNSPNRNFISPILRLYGSVHNLPYTEIKPGEYGVDISKVDTSIFTKVDVFVIYMPIESLDVSAAHLYYAANGYLDKSWREVVINISIAAEVAVFDVCEAYWSRSFNSSNVEKFQNNTSYMAKLRHHLPLAADCIGEKKIDKPIRSALHDLLEHRNQLMHLGKFKTEPSIEQLNRMTMAVFFLREYANKLIANF